MQAVVIVKSHLLKSHLVFQDGDYIWTDGTVEDFRNFASGELNAATGNCTVMDKNGK